MMVVVVVVVPEGPELGTPEGADADGEVDTLDSVSERLPDTIAELDGLDSTELTGELEGVKVLDDVSSLEVDVLE
jgi:hypothetical protein